MKTAPESKKESGNSQNNELESKESSGASLMPPAFNLTASPVQRATPAGGQTTAVAAVTAAAPGDGKVVIVHKTDAKIRKDDAAHAATTALIPRGTLAKEIATGTDSTGAAMVQLEYLSDPTKKYWTAASNRKDVTDKGNVTSFVGYSDTFFYTDPFSKTKMKDGTKDKKAGDQLEVKLKYATDGYVYATDAAGTFLGWLPETSMITADAKKNYDYYAEYKTWLLARITEVGALSGQAKLDRTQGLLSQVEYVSAQVRAGVYPDLKKLSTSPTFNDTNKGAFAAPELIGTVRKLIEITEQEIAVTGGGNLAHSADAKIGGSLFSGIDWNSRMGVPTYRTQSDNLAAPEASCAPTSFTMVMERMGYSRESLIAAIDEKLTSHRLDSYRKNLWAQQEYNRTQYLLTPEGQAAAKKGGTVAVPAGFQPGTPMPADFAPATAMPATFKTNVVIPNDFKPSAVFDAASRDDKWETKVKAYLDQQTGSSLSNYQKIRGNKSGMSTRKDDLADSYRGIAQMEDLVDFLFYTYYPSVGRTSINSGYSQQTMNRVAKAGYNSTEANIGSTEKLDGWKPEHRSKLRACLDAGGGAVMSVYHKGSGETGTHNISIQAVTSTGLTIDDPFGKINPEYRRKSGTSADMYINSGAGNSPSTRDSHTWKNVPHYDAATTSMEDSDFAANKAQNLQADEKRGDSTFISYEMLNESTSGIVNYIVLYNR